MGIAEQFMSFCQGLLATPGAEFGSFLAVGLLAGFTHCNVICGPVAFTLHGGLERPQGLTILPYHMGRLITYLLLALAASMMATAFFLMLPDRAFLVMPALVGAAVLVAATAKHKNLPIPPGLARGVSSGLRQINRIAVAPRLFLTGMLTGLMPCGMTLAVLLVIMARGDALAGIVIMASFWIGTTGALLISQTLLRRGLTNLFKNQRLMPRTNLPIIGALWLIGAAGISQLAS